MAELQGGDTSVLKELGCWQLCAVQTSGCMTTERRTDEQREQQQIALDYITYGGCDVAGLGDTRLGDDASAACAMARGIEGRAAGQAFKRLLEGMAKAQREEALAARAPTARRMRSRAWQPPPPPPSPPAGLVESAPAPWRGTRTPYGRHHPPPRAPRWSARFPGAGGSLPIRKPWQ